MATNANRTLDQVKELISDQVDRLANRSQGRELDESDARKLEVLTKTLLMIIDKQPKKKKKRAGVNTSSDVLTQYAK